MPWYQVVFRYRKGIPDYRNVYAKTAKAAGKKLKGDWYKSTGATISITKVKKRS